MHDAAAELDFEKAALIRDEIRELHNIELGIR
ncbi:MAG: UvrB/UvrC motif-containing protein [Planctomycetes bacterium]|nr:UvrB/UvrC motif-containing protein [Planctomycetota bacterium]